MDGFRIYGNLKNILIYISILRIPQPFSLNQTKYDGPAVQHTEYKLYTHRLVLKKENF